MKRLLIYFASIIILSLLPGKSFAHQPPLEQPRTLIYQIFTDRNKPMQIVGDLTPMHWAALSPGERFLYTERLNEQTQQFSYYVFDFVQKQFTRITGEGKWFPRQDRFIIKKGNVLASYDPIAKTETVLLEVEQGRQIIDFAVAPDEKRLAYLATAGKDAEGKALVQLYVQNLSSLEQTLVDTFTDTRPWTSKYHNRENLYWLPTSGKLFYFADQIMGEKRAHKVKQWDRESGEIFLTAFPQFPSYSPDMEIQVGFKDNVMLWKDPTGQTISLGEGSRMQTIQWAPAGHAVVGIQGFGALAAGWDEKIGIRYQDAAKHFYMPGIYEGTDFRKLQDNFRFIGWAKDGKSFYVADLAPIPGEWYHRLP
ncbi:TolB-like translocation protein [Brevibacillus migulae]|uniref:hypothetical protein n=1 Tax=Brevibacillus migulae TaxID=1644114 RepID=UPI00106E4B9A|nr:hypothetical protein [Brevibacillus migulae]